MSDAMQDNVAIKVNGVSKMFRLPHEKTTSIKSLLINFRKRRTYESQQALKNISFEVRKGEFFGIVGRNGSGKSTLLKLIAGIYSPSKGSIAINGSLTPFIELGVGFNPELTGKENVYLNGALLGFSRREMDDMYDEIVDFAELERFMDQKLKNYSSGMQVRLAFSIAIRAKSEILVLDEVLAVGDEAFQQKCIDVFEDYKAKKQTIVLVSHNMEVVRKFCTRAMLVDDGKVIELGQTASIANKYSQLNNLAVEENIVENNTTVKVPGIDIVTKNAQGGVSTSFRSGETLSVELSWPKKWQSVRHVGIAIVKNSGEYMFGTNTFDMQPIENRTTARYNVELGLDTGKYYLMVGLFGDKESDVIGFVNPGPQFMVRKDPKDLSAGLARLKYQWVSESAKSKKTGSTQQERS